MLYSINGPNLLRLILAEVQETVDYDKSTLEQLCLHWLNESISLPLPEDEALRESFQYLYLLREEDGLCSLEEVWQYLQKRRQQARERVTAMMDRIDRKRIYRKRDYI